MKVRDLPPLLSFLGATGTVTGSRFLLETAHARVLIDAGLFQGLKDLRLRNRETFPVDPASIDAVVVTHAHLDHLGYAPALVANGFRGPIYMTTRTAQLGAIVLDDSARLQEEEAEYANRHGFSKHHPALPLYTQADAGETIEQFRPVPFDTPIEVAPGVHARFRRAGHILGSAGVLLEADGSPVRRVFVSGDVGRPGHPVLRAPVAPPAVDALLVESIALNGLHVPSIIISASGMATGGRVVHHLARLLPDPRNTVVLAGFQAEGTRGRLLANHVASLKMLGHYVPVRAEIVMIDAFSAHADADDLVAWLGEAPSPPDTTYVVHGEPDASATMSARIADALGWNTVVPRQSERVLVR